MRGELTSPVITDIMLEKEPKNAWELLDEHLNTVCGKNGLPISSWYRASSKLIPIVSGDNPPDEYITLDRELFVRDSINKYTHHGQHG